MIQWVLKGMNDGNGYGFPFDQPHQAVANRIKRLDTALEAIKGVRLRGEWKGNKPYHRLFNALKPVMKDRKLWAAVDAIGKKIATYEKLRSAMRIAMPSSSDGLNDDGAGEPIKTIEKRVKKIGIVWFVEKAIPPTPPIKKWSSRSTSTGKNSLPTPLLPKHLKAR